MKGEQFPFAQVYDWENRVSVGSGGFATVYQVKNRKTGEKVAIKEMPMYKFDEEFKIQALHTEIHAMKMCQSPNVVKLLDFSVGSQYTYLVLELCEENLQEFMSKKLMLSQKEVAGIISDIVNGYKFIRENGYIHRDVKPKNILVKKGTWKITDFGFAKKTKFDEEKIRQTCGTPLYMAPQLLYEKEYTDKCDVWSIGLITFQLLFGYPPWTTRYIDTYRKEVVTRQVAFPYSYKLEQDVKDFIQKCLQLEEADRMSWKQLCVHPFVKNARSPEKRRVIVYKEIDVRMQNILARIQRSSENKFVNTKKVFSMYQVNQHLDQENFYRFLMQLDPQITTYESQEIFHLFDTSKDGRVNLQEFRKLYIEIDYKPARDHASRLTEEIVRIALSKNLGLQEFFNIFDSNESRIIDQKQFGINVKKIVPRLEARQIQILWDKFDLNKNGAIEWIQFVQTVTRNMTAVQKVDSFNTQRALRNIEYLINFLRGRNISSQQLFSRKPGDNSRMTIGELDGLLKNIKYSVSKDQVIEMFRLMDTNDSDCIEVTEIQKLLQG